MEQAVKKLTPLDRAVRKIMSQPPCRWETTVDRMTLDDVRKLADRLIGEARWVAELAAYVDARAHLLGHRKAVENTNRKGNQVSRVFGFHQRVNLML
jgi:hypothetical protein